MTKRDRTRESILETSYKLFAQNGFQKVTMKDICDATGLSRGGLYSHFPGTKDIFEAILENLHDQSSSLIHEMIKEDISAVQILDRMFTVLNEEMMHSKDSLSLAMYEYIEATNSDRMNQLNKSGEAKWKQLIEYGIRRGEFKDVDIQEVVNVLLYAYQGVRMWSRIIDMKPAICKSITLNIRKQLVKE